MLVDSHCHLNSIPLINRLPEVYENLIKNDVRAILLACSELEEFEDIINISNQYKNYFVSIGIHPCVFSQTDTDLDFNLIEEKFDKYINQYKNKILCIGECGLDYHYYSDDITKKSQAELFKFQLEIARKFNLPVMIHTRDAGIDTYNILKEFVKTGGKGVIHCFTGTYDDALRYLELEFYISACGMITYNNKDQLRKTFSKIPLDKLLIETDSPYITPKPFLRNKNEPAYVKYTAEKLAELQGVSFEEIASVTTENFKRIYNIDF
ncbi:MAG: TatD family hydrolase [Treponema sp.]|nr:TatD family hydrolase [Treponema sp.]MCL2251621.1 TatD family hydrolase [Treponema sp.]